MGLLYTILYAVFFVLLIPVFIYRMWKRGKYRENFFQRFGRYAPELHEKLSHKTGPRFWIQAVSVGEVNLALMLINALRKNFPGYQIVLSTTTSTGYALAQERIAKDVVLLYFPQDFPACVRRAYDLVQPDAMILMESELWPNHVWEGARRKVPLLLINARMSDRSASRHKYGRWLFGRVFDKLSLVCAQSPQDAENFRKYGVPANRLHMAGNLKYDAALPQSATATINPRQILTELGIDAQRPVIVAGSTFEGEEEILFDLLAKVRAKIPDVFLVLVPRHHERSPGIIELAKRKSVALALRKNGAPLAKPPECLLVNTTGELRWFYDIATVAFVGKSLTQIGGQNLLEPAAAGSAVVFGPHMENFRAIVADFLAAGACRQVQDADELCTVVEELLTQPARRREMAAAAQRVINANVGATDRTVNLIADVLKSARK